MGVITMRRVIIPILFLALFFIPFCTVSAAPSTVSKEYKVNDKFLDEKLKVKDNTFILDLKKEDINNDNILDDIMLIGHKKEGVLSHFSEDIEIIVQNGGNKKINRYPIGDIRSGYGARLFIGDFNGDKLSDILSMLQIGDNGELSVYSLISINKNKFKPIFNQKSFYKGLNFDIAFVDEFKISVFNKELSKFYTLDAKKKKYSYVECGIYNEKGETKQSAKGKCSSFEELTPIDIDNDGVYELKGIQRITGLSDTDTLGFAKSIWKFSDDEVKLKSLEVIPYPNPRNPSKPQRIMPVWKKNFLTNVFNAYIVYM
jgi:hypothetical protein